VAIGVIAPLSKLEGLIALRLGRRDTQVPRPIAMSAVRFDFGPPKSDRMSRDAENVANPDSVFEIEHEIPIDASFAKIWFAGGILPARPEAVKSPEAVMGTETVSRRAPEPRLPILGKWFSRRKQDEGVIAMNAPAKITFRIAPKVIEVYDRGRRRGSRRHPVYRSAIGKSCWMTNRNGPGNFGKTANPARLGSRSRRRSATHPACGTTQRPRYGPAQRREQHGHFSAGKYKWFSGRLLKC